MDPTEEGGCEPWQVDTEQGVPGAVSSSPQRGFKGAHGCSLSCLFFSIVTGDGLGFGGLCLERTMSSRSLPTWVGIISRRLSFAALALESSEE